MPAAFAARSALADRELAGRGVGEDVPFDEQPLARRHLRRGDVPVGEPAGHREAGAHGALGVRGDDAHAGAGRLADERRVGEVDVQFGELGRVVEAVAVVTDAADERALTAELRAGDDRVGHAPAADQPQLAVAERGEQLLLVVVLGEAHRPLVERERAELRVGEFEEDVDQRVAEADEVEVFHVSGSVSGGRFVESLCRERTISRIRPNCANGTTPARSSGPIAATGSATSQVQTTTFRRFNFVRG